MKISLIKLTILVSIVCSSFFSQTVYAQVKIDTFQNVIQMNLGVFNKFKLKYERVPDAFYSFGAYGAAYYCTIPGFQVQPFFRIYPGSMAPRGIFAQAKVIFAQHYYTDPWNTALFTYPTFDQISFGGGASAGYQVVNNPFTFEVSLGFKYIPVVNHSPDSVEGNWGIWYGPIWYSFGPGSVIDGTFSIGFSF